MISERQLSSLPQTPIGINHVVLHVRNIEDSHAFWTECLGFKHVATSTSRDGASAQKPGRFYSGGRDGRLNHHDLALVEDPAMARDPERFVVDHLAIGYADEDAWNRQVEYLRSREVPVRHRIRRGTTLSAHVTDPSGYTIELVCELPRELWESDIATALNQKPIPLD